MKMNEVLMNRLLAALLLVLIALQSAAAQERVVEDELETVFAQALAEGANAWDHDELLWLVGTRDHGKIEPLLERLRMGVGENASPLEQQHSLLLGLLLERDGKLPEALEVLKALPESTRTFDLALEIAQLQDMLGQTAEARKSYEALLTTDIDPSRRKTLELRLALLEPEKNYDSLLKYAASDELDAEERNEATVILGLGGREKEAVGFFTVSGEKGDRFRELVRLAEWSLGAKEHEKAQGLAWDAVKAAITKRDRRYALSLVASAYRAADQIEALLETLAKTEEHSNESRALWVDLLREEGRALEALDLVQKGAGGDWGPQLKRQLLEICRETGDDEVLISAFRELITNEPRSLEWRSGLSRHFLENGQSAEAREVWKSLPAEGIPGDELLDAARQMLEVGLSGVARDVARRVAADPRHQESALLFLARLENEQGDREAMVAVLKEIEDKADAKAGIRAEIAGEYERIGRLDLAVATLEDLRQAHDGFLGTDLEMKYALTLSKVGREEDAMTIWRELWGRLRGTPRGRYVEDRLMTVASRIGLLAKIAIELEDRLAQGSADMKDIDLLVRLYIKVSDPASATEIIEEYLKKVGSADLDILKRKAQIYAACNDYYHYEKVCHQLIELDEENRLDHMRELVMSQLDRGRRDEAIAMLPKIRAAGGETEAIADEFEAGVYGLAGLKERALESYMRGLGRNPDRIDTLLLVANLMQETGAEIQAARRFQNLAMRADKDDLFTIAIDGLLNLRAPRQSRVPDSIVSWALRLTLERLARNSDKFYLYRLATDLAVELNDMPFAIRTLKAAVPIAGERRTPLLREIMSKARTLDRSQRQVFGFAQDMKVGEDWDASDYLMVGRRLLGQGEYVPPQVFMDMAAVFLAKDKVADAMRTFSRASELLERGEVTLQAAQVLEKAGCYAESLTFYRRLLATDAENVVLLQKVAEIEELSGANTRARQLYDRGFDVAAHQLLRRVVRDESEEEKEEDPWGYSAQRNVDALSATIPKLVAGIIATLPDDGEIEKTVASMAQKTLAELEETRAEEKGLAENLADHPRLECRVRALRRLALGFRLTDAADRVDLEIGRSFPKDEEALKQMIAARTERGLTASAAGLLRRLERESMDELAAMAGIGGLEGRRLSASAVAREIIPSMDEPEKLSRYLERVDTAQATEVDLKSLPHLLAASLILEQMDSAENFARSAIRLISVRGFEGMDQGMNLLGVARRISPRLAQELLETMVDRVLEKQPQLASSLSWRIDEVPGVEISEQMIRSIAKRMVESRTKGRPVYGLGNWVRKVAPASRPEFVRELHDLLDPDQRAYFLNEAASSLVDPLEESYVAWFARALETALSSSQNGNNQNIRPPQGEAPLALKLAILDVLERKGGVEGLQILRWTTLIDAKRSAEVVEQIKAKPEEFIQALGDQGMTRYYTQQMVDRLAREELLAPLRPILAKALELTPEAEAIQQLYLRVLSHEDTDAYESELEKAIEKKPDDLSMLSRLRGVKLKKGDILGSIEVLKRLIAANPDNPRYVQQLMSTYAARRMPLEAEKVRLSLEEKEGKGNVQSGGATSFVTIGGGTVIRAVSIGGSGAAGKNDPVDEVRELLKAGKNEEARARLRRIWRGLGETSRYPLPVAYRLRWHDPNPGPKKKDEKQYRTVLGAAAGEADFIAAEAARVLLFLEEGDGEAEDHVVSELVDLALPEKPEARQALLARLRQGIEQGVAGRREVTQLFRLLEDAWVTDGLRAEVMDELVARRSLPQARQIRGLARGLAVGGRKEQAKRFYRLTALMCNGSTDGGYMNDVESWQELLSEAEASLGAEEARETVLAMIDNFRPSDYRLGSWLLLAARNWERILPVEEALPRMNALLGDVTDEPWATQTIRSMIARLALNSADLETALSVLEQPLLRDQKKTFDHRGQEIEIHRSEGQARSTVARIWQRHDPETNKTESVEVDLNLLYRGLKAWHDEGKIEFPAGVFPVLVERMFEAELMTEELAREFDPILATLESESATLPRARTKLARLLGNDELAYELETKMLSENQLGLDQFAQHLRELEAHENLDRALELGLRLAATCHHPDLLEVIADMARRAEKPEVAAEYLDLRERVLAQEAADKARLEAASEEEVEEEIEEMP